MSGNDAEPWNLLHDGTIVAIERDGDDVVVSIDCAYVRARLPGERGCFRLRLRGVRALGHARYAEGSDLEPEVTDHDAIVAAKPDISNAETTEAGTLLVSGGLGVLRADYDDCAVELSDGTPVPFVELREAVAAYWKDWRDRLRPDD